MMRRVKKKIVKYKKVQKIKYINKKNRTATLRDYHVVGLYEQNMSSCCERKPGEGLGGGWGRERAGGVVYVCLLFHCTLAQIIKLCTISLKGRKRQHAHFL